MTYVVLTKPECEWCVKTKELLAERHESFIEFNIIEHPSLREFLLANNIKTVPQIYRNGFHIGGYAALEIELFIDQAVMDMEEE